MNAKIHATDDSCDLVKQLRTDADRRFEFAKTLSNMGNPLVDNEEGRTVTRLRKAADLIESFCKN